MMPRCPANGSAGPPPFFHHQPETGFGAAVFGRRFRLYSIATMVIVPASAAMIGTYTSALQADLPTPWVGVWERVSSTAYMLWIAVLAVVLLRSGSSQETGRDGL